MGKGLLPHGQIWVGCDPAGNVVAASIEAKKPDPLDHVFDGCVEIHLCRVPPTGSIFGTNLTDLEKVKEL